MGGGGGGGQGREGRSGYIKNSFFPPKYCKHPKNPDTQNIAVIILTC